MLDNLETQPLEESALKKLSFDKKKILLGVINGSIDKHHAAKWLLSIEKHSIKQITSRIVGNNDAAANSSVDAKNKAIRIFGIFYITVLIISLILITIAPSLGMTLFLFISVFSMAVVPLIGLYRFLSFVYKKLRNFF